MKPDAQVENGGSGAGMSRAAKKRAKKKNKNNSNSNSNNNSNEMKRVAESLDDQEYAVNKKIKLIDSQDGDVKQKVKKASLKNYDDDDDDDDIEEFEKAAAKDDGIAADSPMELEENEPLSLPNTPLVDILLINKTDSEEKQEILENLTAKERAKCLFQAIIEPISLEEFYTEYWEKKPLLVPATKDNKKRYKDLLTLKSIKEMSRKTTLYYARDLNVTRYQKDSDGIKRRMTLDKLPPPTNDGSSSSAETSVPVDSKELWKNYDNGCTIRLLCPHKHTDSVHALLSTLELELQCMVGANAYLTPPKGSQGFAPHYDDIEAFCLQLEGSKRWKVYPPKLKLPRASSEDYTPQDLEGVEPVIDVVLREGDLLYMPRGWIHQACTQGDDNEHSLHLTVSAMQQWAWIDLLELVMPDALEAAAMSETSTSLRQGLPRGFLDYMGLMYEEPSDEKLPESLRKLSDNPEDVEMRKYRKMLQENFRAEAKKRIMKVAKAANDMIDAACDQLAKRFISERQPPAFTKSELASTIKGMDDGGTATDNKNPILPNTLCRIARPGIARLVIEDDKAIVYHCGDNSREFQGHPLSPMEYEMDDGPAIEQLFTTVEPHWIFVNDLFHDTIEDKIAIVESLFDEGIVSIRSTDQAE